MLCHSLLDPLEVLSNVTFQIFRQIDVVHGGISGVKHHLELALIRVCCGQQYGKLSKNVRIEDGTDEVNGYAEEKLARFLRTHFITTDDKGGIVEADTVDKYEIFILDFAPESFRPVIEIVGRYPRSNSNFLEFRNFALRLQVVEVIIRSFISRIDYNVP